VTTRDLYKGTIRAFSAPRPICSFVIVDWPRTCPDINTTLINKLATTAVLKHFVVLGDLIIDSLYFA
jgi:hypothetical protein